MRRDDLKRAVAKQTGLNDSQADAAVRAVFTTIEESLSKGDEVSISGFGAFHVAERPAREGLHPQTRKPMRIEARKSPVFKPGARLKRAVNGDEAGDDEE